MKNYIRYATQLENDVVNFILKKYANKYISQLKNIYVSSREHTGVGMYVHFKRIDPLIEPVDKESPNLCSVYADLDGLKFGAGFVLYIDEGNINMLEMFSQAEGQWPEVINEFTLENL